MSACTRLYASVYARIDGAHASPPQVTELQTDVQQKSNLISSMSDTRRQLNELSELYREAQAGASSYILHPPSSILHPTPPYNSKTHAALVTTSPCYLRLPPLAAASQDELLAYKAPEMSNASDAEVQRQANEDLIKKLLKEQRKAFELETADLRNALAAKTEAEQKEARIEMLRKTASRRMLFAGIQRGWEAWVELCAAKREAKQVLRQIGSRVQVHAPCLPDPPPCRARASRCL